MGRNVSRDRAKIAKKALIERLLEACQDIPALKFTETNKEFDFDYVKASQLYDQFRTRLMDRKIMVLTEESEISHAQFDRLSETYRETTLKVTFEVRDCLSEASLSRTHFGVGVAPIHTGFSLYIAKTMAAKYFLRGLAMVPWAEGDQEFQNKKNQGLEGIEADQPKRNMTRAEKVEDSNLRAWHSAMMRGGKTEVQVAEYLIGKHNAVSIRDLFLPARKLEFAAALQWVQATMPSEDDVEIVSKVKSITEGAK